MVSAGAALGLAAGVFGVVIGLSAATPAGATSNANTSYEYDCTTTLSPGTVAPYGVTANLNTTANSLTLPGATFGASGALTYTLVGPVIAGTVIAGVNSGTTGLTISNQTIASTDGTATGSYVYSGTWTPVANNTTAVAGASWTSGSATVSGNFSSGMVGDGIDASGHPFPSGSVIGAVNPGVSATLSAAATASGTGTVTVYGPMNFTTGSGGSPALSIASNQFTTLSPPVYNGDNVDIGLTTLSGLAINVNLTVQFGKVSGGEGWGTSNCLETGYGPSNAPGPAQDNGTNTNTSTGPIFPPGETTQLVAASGGFLSQPNDGIDITPPTAAYATAVATPPTPNNQTVTVGTGATGSVTLSAAAGSFPVSSTGFSIVGASGSPPSITLTGPNGNVVATQAATGSANVALDATAVTAPETVAFTFNACDTEPTPVCSTSPGTITISVGTPPVIQPLSEQVNAGLLVLSCDSPATYVTASGSPPSYTSNPSLLCNEFQFPTITLDGLQQTVTGTTGNNTGSPAAHPGTIYVSDNRGLPLGDWTLTGAFVPTTIGNGQGQNPNTYCSGVAEFCNANVGSAVNNVNGRGYYDGRIPSDYLSVSNISCTADFPGNLNPNANPETGGNFGSPVNLCWTYDGESGGTFMFNATYTLTIPESVYAGNYWGSVQYTVVGGTSPTFGTGTNPGPGGGSPPPPTVPPPQ